MLVRERAKLLRTLNVYLIFLGLGMCVAIPGPTLLELQRMAHTDSGHITLIFISRSIGYLLGSIIGGILLDMFNKELILVIATALSGISLSAVPWWRSLLPMSLVIFATGMTMGCLDTGGNIRCLELWSKESGIYLQILHFCFGLGAFIAPLIVEPFLSENAIVNSIDLIGSNSSNETIASEIPLTTELPTQFPIRYAYGIVGGFNFVVALWSAITFLLLPKEKQSAQREERKISTVSLPLFITIMLLVALLMCIVCGVEIGYGQLIATFAVRSDLRLTESIGSYMTSVYWGMYTFARFFSIFLVMCSSLICPILFNLTVIVLGSVALSIFGNTQVVMLWLGTALLGFGMSSMFPSVLAWLEHDIPLNSKVASIFVVGAALGEMVFPLSVGHFIDGHPISLMYSTLICSCSCVVIFAVIWKLSILYTKKEQRKETAENVPPSSRVKTVA